MRRLVFFLSSTALVFSCLPAAAQEQATSQTAPSVYTTVSGHVTCGDTGHPARFAAVQLIPEKPQPKQTSDYANVKNDEDLAKLQARHAAQAQKGTGLTAVSSIDGSFEMPQVPPGTYYVVAQLKGYISPFAPEDMFTDRDGAIRRTQAQADKIVVQDAPVRADVRLERGGSINGVIRYDDGSPATGVRPVLMVMQDDGKWKHNFSFTGMPGAILSDDRGHYRIGGLAKGKYAVKAELPTVQTISGPVGSSSMHSNLGDALVVYSGGVFREKEIKPIEVGAGEDVNGIDIVFPLDNIHQVSGIVAAKTDNHPVNSGWVNLNDPDTKAVLRHTKIEEDGSFKFSYVPEGQYLLVTSRAGDTDKSAPVSAMVQMLNPTFLKKYQDATLPIEVKGDLTGLVVQVADQPAAGAPAKPSTP
ncbi:MAG: carboxypeptidase-like regulatory domain-containing protein [Terracidiphilus sp.]|jgi:hypothetical protein